MGDRGSICEAVQKKKPHLKENLDEQASRTSSPCKSFVGLREVRDRAWGWGVAWERGGGGGSLVVTPFLRQRTGVGLPRIPSPPPWSWNHLEKVTLPHCSTSR